MRNLYESPYAELVAVCDARPEALAQIGRRYPGLRQTTEFAEVLADAEVEAVVVATPISTHYPLARAARPGRPARSVVWWRRRPATGGARARPRKGCRR